MPNQRKQSKVNLGGYFEESLALEIQRIAEDRGISVSALLEEWLEAAVADYKKRNRLKFPEHSPKHFELNEPNSSKDTERKVTGAVKRDLEKDQAARGSHPKSKK